MITLSAIILNFESLVLWPWDEQLCSSLHLLLREISGSLATKCCTVLVSYLLNVSVCSFVFGRLCTVALAETAACRENEAAKTFS